MLAALTALRRGSRPPATVDVKEWPCPSKVGSCSRVCGLLVTDRGPRQIWFGTDHDAIGRVRVP
jgi:hypothetical protein